MIYENIKSEIKEAMKSKDFIKRDCLRSVLGKARDIMKAKFSNSDTDDIPDSIMMEAVEKEAKQLNQTIDCLKGCEGADLYIVSKNQLEILSMYLPKKMDKKEVEEAVSWILCDNNRNNFGENMKIVMKELRGKADSNIIREVVATYK